MKSAQGVETKLPARMEPYRERSEDPPLPPIAAPHLYEWLMEVGPIAVDGMGQTPITWSMIRDWAALTFKRLSAWEARTLRRLSTEYLAELRAAEDHMRPAPWVPTRAEVKPEDAERQLRAVLG